MGRRTLALSMEYTDQKVAANHSVFTAVYGTTTADQVAAAVTAGKLVFCKYTDSTHTIHQLMLVDDGQSKYVFSEVSMGSTTVSEITHTSYNGWSAALGKENNTWEIVMASGSIPATLSELSEDANHRTVSDADKAGWNSKEAVANKVTALTAASTDTQYPSAKCVYDLYIGANCLESISIDTPPTKTIYREGETFNPAGMVVAGVYKNHVHEVKTNYTYSPSGPLTEGTTAITISVTEDGITKTTTQNIIVGDSFVVGVCWNYGSQSTQLTRLTEDTDPNEYVNLDVTTEPVPAVGTGAGSSPFDSIYPWSDMDEYNIINDEVSYRKGEQGFSRTIYDTMVKIPEFYFKILDDPDATKRYFYISDAPKDGFSIHPGSGRYVGRYNTKSGTESKSGYSPQTSITRASARASARYKGDKWSQYDFASWCALLLLYLVEYADMDGQGTVGQGIVTGSSQVSGQTDSMVFHTGRAEGTNGATAIQYRHVENMWGNVNDWVDGININSGRAYICLDPDDFADDTADGYTDTGFTLPINSSGAFPKTLAHLPSYPWCYFPATTGGSDSSYVPDKFWTNSGWRVLYVGGYYNSGAVAGPFYFFANYDSSNANGYVGARLLYTP